MTRLLVGSDGHQLHPFHVKKKKKTFSVIVQWTRKNLEDYLHSVCVGQSLRKKEIQWPTGKAPDKGKPAAHPLLCIYWPSNLQVSKIRKYNVGTTPGVDDLGGGCRGCAPPPP